MLRKFFTFLGSVILMLLLVIILLPFLFPVENYRDDILEIVQEKTGRKVAIEGDLSVTLLPEIALEVNGVTVGNPEGFVSSYMAKVGTLQLKMALWPLLSKQIEVNELALSDAEIYLEEAVGGKKNWEFTYAKINKTAAVEKEKASKSNFRINVDSVIIEDTKLHYIKPGKKFSTEKLNLDYTKNESKLDLVLKHAGTNYHFGLQTPSSSTLFSSQKTPLTVAMRSPLIKADFGGDLHGVDLSSGKFDASLAGELSANLLTMVKVNSRKFSANLKKASLGLLSVEGYKGISATGDMVVSYARYARKKPHIETTLSIPELNLDALFAKPEQKQSLLPFIRAAHAADDWSREPVNLSTLTVLDADAKLSVGKLISSGYELSDFTSSMRLAGGILNIHNFMAGFLGGKVSGTATVGYQGQWNKALVLKDIPFEKLAATYMDDIAVTGMTNGNISLRSHGKSMHDWMHRLSGGGNLTISDGIIKGFSLPKLFRKAVGLNPETVVADPNENTPFSAIKTAFSVDKGIMRLREGSLRSKRLKADASGTVSFAGKRVDLLLTPELLPQVEVAEGEVPPSGLMVPVKVKGSFDKIKVKPDYSKVIGNILKDPKNAEKTLKNFKTEGKAIEDSFEPTKDAIKQNWKDLKENKNPEALKNIFKELDKTGIKLF